MSNFLADLKLVLSTEEYTAISNLPETLLEPIWNSKSGEIGEVKRQEVAKNRKKNFWRDEWVAERCKEELDDADIKALKHRLNRLLISNTDRPAPESNRQRWILDRVYTEEKGGLVIPKELIPWINRMVEDDYEAAMECYEYEIDQERRRRIDNTQNRGGGRRKSSPFQGEKIIKNPDDPEGKDHEFYFKGDEEATFTKPSGKPKDGKQTLILKAAKSSRYMGGATCNPFQCQGAVGWDRAQGSLAIKKTGLSYAMFKQQCGASKELGEDYCSKCAKNPINFFTDTYSIKKGKATKYDGVSYQKFIEDNLEYASTNELCQFISQHGK